MKVGDIVVFLKLEKEASFGTPVWKVARVTEVHGSKDGTDRAVTLEYKNPGEDVFRSVNRALRSVALLLPEDEITLGELVGLAHEQAMPLAHATWKLIV